MKVALISTQNYASLTIHSPNHTTPMFFTICGFGATVLCYLRYKDPFLTQLPNLFYGPIMLTHYGKICVLVSLRMISSESLARYTWCLKLFHPINISLGSNPHLSTIKGLHFFHSVHLRCRFIPSKISWTRQGFKLFERYQLAILSYPISNHDPLTTT